MSTISQTSPFNETTYRAGLILEAELATPFSAFVGTNPKNAVVVEDRPGNGRGDAVKLRFAAIPSDRRAKTEGMAIIGQEATEVEYENSVELHEAVYDRAIENFPTEQNRVSFDLRQEKLTGLAKDWGYYYERCSINHAVGNTIANAETNPFCESFGVPVVAQDTAHIYRCRTSAGAVPASDAAVAADATCVLDSGVIGELVNWMTQKDRVAWPFLPCMTPFGELFGLMVHGDGYEQLVQNISGNDIYDLHKAAIQGGVELSGTPFATAEGFIYKKTLVLRNNFMPQGITSSAYQANTRTALFFGARMAHRIYGTGFTDGDHIGYTEFKQHDRLSMKTKTLVGSCRNIVNGQSWACTRVVHYVPS